MAHVQLSVKHSCYSCFVPKQTKGLEHILARVVHRKPQSSLMPFGPKTSFPVWGPWGLIRPPPAEAGLLVVINPHQPVVAFDSLQ